jgi:hypothetical protein
VPSEASFETADAVSLSMARDGGLGHVRVGAAGPGMFAAYAAWSAREIELQALATLAALAQISTPSAAHFLKSHQLLVQKFAADRDRQKKPRLPLDRRRVSEQDERFAALDSDVEPIRVVVYTQHTHWFHGGAAGSMEKAAASD